MSGMLVCGVINWDTLLFVEHLPASGEEVRVNRIISVPGGKGANTAVAAARILGPAKVGIIAMLGSDDIAEKQIVILEGEGVDTSCIMRHTDVGSGQAYVIASSIPGSMSRTTFMFDKARISWLHKSLSLIL